MWYFGVRRKLKKAMTRTWEELSGCEPPVAEHFFYGAVETDPRSVAMWYVFETDAELERARVSGLCDQLAEATNRHLEQLRYPADVRGRVSFASRETIDSTPGGPRMYFQ